MIPLFLIREEKPFINKLVRLLGVSSLATCVEINWHKLCAY